MPDEAGFREEDFRDFVETRSSALLRTAYLLAGDWATAEDLLQIALTKTYLAWKRLGHIEAVEPYARRVLVNTATSWWRRRWHGERPTEILPESAAADRVEESLERDALWRHVRELPNRQRAVLVLRFYEDQSEAETARLLGVSVGTVKSQASRALATLRQRLSAEGIEPAARPARPPTVRLRPAVPAKTVKTAAPVQAAEAAAVVPKEQPAREDECETPEREAVLVETSGSVEVGLVT
ncbi:SigE family RNA polymerase sigma factor [Dactylosporangium sp. NPDC005555]|uniref:SigE family RNA polymerase sigma factor n=1 Tax=Dactylosporangium sp. NPDC005555 TaxID=3154889 RepID=UPI0033BF70A8